VFIGIRFPKQNHIALGLIDHFNNTSQTTTAGHAMPLFLLMGASYEFYLNLKKRAPRFWQKTGLEWFYRFTQEPGRLFKRYFVDDMQFFPIVWREMRKK
ncbi:MAG: WecB/TagA/CpsF family glycosyltransferase, partial [Chitinophagales bacterium]